MLAIANEAAPESVCLALKMKGFKVTRRKGENGSNFIFPKCDGSLGVIVTTASQAMGKYDMEKLEQRISTSVKSTKRTLVIVVHKGTLPEAITNKLLLASISAGSSWHQLQDTSQEAIADCLFGMVKTFEKTDDFAFHFEGDEARETLLLVEELQLALAQENLPAIILKELARCFHTILDVALCSPSDLQQVLNHLHLDYDKAQGICEAARGFLESDAICRK